MMKYCRSCGVNVPGSPIYCPTCSGGLEDVQPTNPEESEKIMKNLIGDIKPKVSKMAVVGLVISSLSMVILLYGNNFYRTRLDTRLVAPILILSILGALLSIAGDGEIERSGQRGAKVAENGRRIGFFCIIAVIMNFIEILLR